MRVVRFVFPLACRAAIATIKVNGIDIFLHPKELVTKPVENLSDLPRMNLTKKIDNQACRKSFGPPSDESNYLSTRDMMKLL